MSRVWLWIPQGLPLQIRPRQTLQQAPSQGKISKLSSKAAIDLTSFSR